jgi:hypothetical protein
MLGDRWGWSGHGCGEKHRLHREWKLIAHSGLILNSMESGPFEKPPVAQVLKNSPKSYETRRFVTVITSVRHWLLSWVRWIQSISPKPVSLRAISVLSSHVLLCLCSGFFPSGFPVKILYAFLFSCPAYLNFLDLIILITFGEEHRLGSSPLCWVRHNRNCSVKNNILPELQNITSLSHIRNIFFWRSWILARNL